MCFATIFLYEQLFVNEVSLKLFNFGGNEMLGFPGSMTNWPLNSTMFFSEPTFCFERCAIFWANGLGTFSLAYGDVALEVCSVRMGQPEHGVNGGLGRSPLFVVTELGNHFVVFAATLVNQLERSVSLVKSKAPPHQNVKVSCKKEGKFQNKHGAVRVRGSKRDFGTAKWSAFFHKLAVASGVPASLS